MATELPGPAPDLSPPALGGRRASALGWACLVGLGLLAGLASIFLRLRLGVPGHAILRAALPAALGLALVPWRLSGCVVSGTAFASVLAAGALGVRGPGV